MINRNEKEILFEIEVMSLYQWTPQLQGIAYISSYNSLPSMPPSHSANLSRFNVSPPNPVIEPVRRSRIIDGRNRLLEPVRSRTLDSRNRLMEPVRSRTLDWARNRVKTVTWSSDRKSNAKELSEDRKVVKSQVIFSSLVLRHETAASRAGQGEGGVYSIAL